MKRPAGWLAILAVAAFAATAQAPAARNPASWRRVDVPHFTVIGSVNDRELVEVATAFERYRDALAELFPSAATATVVPTVVLVFDSGKSFDAFKPLVQGKPRESDGLVVSSPDLDYVALAVGSRGMRGAFHEYVHLVTAHLRAPLPLWLAEGIAEYYSTFESPRGGNKASIGEPIPSHLMLLKSEWLEFDDLRATGTDSPRYDEGERRSVLYAESWAFVHFLMHATPSRRDHLEKYLSAIESGMSADEAWNRIFGQQTIENALREYVDRAQSRMIGSTITSRVEVAAPVANAMSDADAAAFLGDYLVRAGREADGKARLKSVARAEGPGGDWLADYMFAATVANTVAPEANAEQISAARSALQRTLRSRPDLAHASYLLAGLALQAGDLEAARDASETAAFLAPARFEYTLRLAEVFTQRKEYTKARSVLGPLMTNPAAAGIRERVRTQLASIADAERAAAAAATSAAPAPETPPGGPLLDLRRLQSGEERTAGLLARIDCDRKKGVTFHVRVESRTEEYRAVRFQDVEFVSYRDDLAGEVKCGARETEDLVYVTWKEAAPAAAGAPPSKTIVAVEFLPKDYKPKN
jgi:tetratricopeptide (TPR) repeat protein